MKRLAVALFILLPSLWCRAQSFTTINYSIPEGLPSSEVYEIFQDRHGFLWFATDNGVVKFDGSEMQKFSIAEGLTDPVVFGFHEDLKGRLWFRTFSGRLCYLEDEKIHPYRYNDSLAKHISASVVHSLYVDSLEQLWFSCYRDRGVWGKIDRHGNVEKSYCDNFQIFYKDFGDTYLSGYSNRDSLSHISINGKVFPYIPSNPNCAQLQVLAVTWKGKNYISFCKDLFEYDDRQMKHVMSYDWPIVSLSKDNDDNLWIGFLNDGVRRFTNNDFKDAWSPAFLRNFSVTRVLHDNENGLWFGTLEQGIFYIPNVSIKNYSIDPSQKILMVSKLKKEMLVGTNNGLIISFNEQGEQKKTRSYPAPLNGFYADSYDRVWISDKSGTFRTDAKFKITKRFANMAFFNFTQGTDGTVWTISSRYVSKIDRHDSLSTFRTDFIYRTLLEENSQILLATRNGLHIYDRNMKFVREIKELANHKISKITGLRDSLYLITTVGSGFILFNMNGLRYQQFKSVANNVYASLVTEESLWLGTEKGLVK
ncbi:MAG: ligand-binding sensor domain-containing protein, partial [Bacteroidota bacterium]